MFVDTSVLIDYLRTLDAQMLALMQQHGASVCGIVRAEVLCGTLGPKHRQRLLNVLNSFQQVSTPEALWDTVGDNLAVLRARGVSVPFSDVVIATIAIGNNLELWARDRHFPIIQQHLPALRLFQEPP
jgi:predicted nucleic acid-binding protein